MIGTLDELNKWYFHIYMQVNLLGAGKFFRYCIQSIKTIIQLSRYWNWAVILNAMKICVKASVGIYFRICGFVQLFLCFMWTGINWGSVKVRIIQGTFSLHVFLHEVGSCVRTFNYSMDTESGWYWGFVLKIVRRILFDQFLSLQALLYMKLKWSLKTPLSDGNFWET